MKDIEKAMVGSSESYAVLKAKLENLPENVVIIGSHTQMDNRKEKVSSYLFFSVSLFEVLWYQFNHLCSVCCLVNFVLEFLCFQSHPGGLLFTKFGSNQTALLDLAFPVC